MKIRAAVKRDVVELVEWLIGGHSTISFSGEIILTF